MYVLKSLFSSQNGTAKRIFSLYSMKTTKRTKGYLLKLYEHEHKALQDKAKELHTTSANLIRTHLLNLITNEENDIRTTAPNKSI